jgi:uncharacterized membrane protein YjgN (DUF898 family)
LSSGSGGGQVNATMLLVMGILGIVCCGFIAPFAWVKSNSAIATLNAGGGQESDRSMVNVARILGIIGTVLLILSLLWVVLGGGLAAMTAASRPPGVGMPPTLR